MREISEVHRQKTDNRKKSVTNFGNLKILIVRCLAVSEIYRKVLSVSKSDENWICYNDF